MGTTQNIFYSYQLSLKKFWFDSTHDSQWLYRNWFKSTHDSKWISENWLKSTHDSKSSRIFWFKSTHDSKKLSRILIQINSWLKKSGILIWINSWLNDSNQPLISLTFFWAFTQFRWPFLGFHSISLTFFGHSTKCLDSNQLMTQAVSRRLESIQLMTQATFQELTQNQLMTQVDSPGIDSDWLMTQSASPFFDSNQLMTQAKNIWFWVGSWFDSESYPCLTLTFVKVLQRRLHKTRSVLPYSPSLQITPLHISSSIPRSLKAFRYQSSSFH